MKTVRLHRTARKQRGVVLLFCLIILVVLLAGGVAVMRSMNTSLYGAGNLAFKRDLLNQGELAVSKAMVAFKTGGNLATAAATTLNLASENYSATELRTNDHGIPEVLLKKGTPSGPDITGATFTPTGGDIAGRGNVTVRYVIDRMCGASGSFAKSGCVYSPSMSEVSGGSRPKDALPTPVPPIYRVTVRVDGPRNTQVFLQTSFTKPE